MKNKEVVCGLGEIGKPIFNLLSTSFTTQGFDIDSKCIPKSKLNFEKYETRFLHICIPFNPKFQSNNSLKEFANKKIDKQYKFSDNQKNLIYKLIEEFES